jgi:rRNA-processing protein FCF1
LQKVIFDSSFLMAVAERPTQWEADIEAALGKYDPVLLRCVKDELTRMTSGKGRRPRYAKVALAIADAFSVAPCGKGGTDDEIMSWALSNGAAVATIDGDLSKALTEAHVRVISLRDGRTWAP